MINRENWKIVKRYLEYTNQVQQRDKATVDRTWVALRKLLEWADSTRLANIRDIRPVFPRYLTDLNLSHESIERCCNTTRALFAWLKEESPQRWMRITDSWLDTLHPPKRAEQPNTHDAYTIDDVRKMMSVRPYSLGERRDQAAVAMLFLSGMRVGAFTTLTIDCVDLATRSVKQWPEKGVKTKNLKRATTYLLDIPDLIDVVARWDAYIRHELPITAMWFPSLKQMGTQLATLAGVGHSRGGAVVDGLKLLCSRAGVAYKSPHKLRHGHAVYALELARDVADLKAISQNLMHKDLKTTDGIYSILSDDDVMKRIERLTK
jgi:site-specific recombinase XerD